MTEEQYFHGQRLQKRISEELGRKQRISDLLEKLEEKKVHEKPGKMVGIVCTEERMHYDQISKIEVDEDNFEEYLRAEISRITESIETMQDEFHRL